MATNYTNHFNTKATPQSEPVPGKNQVQNNAGGYVFALSAQNQLNRFLILGSEGGSYYVGEKKLTQENATSIVELIQQDGVNVVKTVVDVSVSGRAPKNDPAIFVLALCAAFGDQATKTAAYDAISKVCRIGTHLFTFLENVQALRGWSRGLRTGVAKFYTGKSLDQLAMQVVKYRQRNGWSHRDALLLAHVKPENNQQADILRFAAGKEPVEFVHPTIEGFRQLQELAKGDEKKAVALINKYGLPREAVPTDLLNSVKVWEALNEDMPITATIRNLGKMTSLGLLKDNMDDNTRKIVTRLSNPETIKKSRVHPIDILNAMRVYRQGHGDKGSLVWNAVPAILDVLDDAFYTSFGNVETTGKRHFLGLDCSGSMFGAHIAGTGLTAADAAGAMAMVTLKAEPNSSSYYFNTGCQTLDLSKKKRLDDVLKVMQAASWGGTDCAQPMIYALKNQLKIDTFVVYTDNETWAGNIHPFQALKDYRQKMGIDAKLIVVGTSAVPFTIADPSDKGMLDVVGFDTSTPQVLSEFSKGNI